VYEYTVFEGEHYSPMEFTETDNVVVINSASKLFLDDWLAARMGVRPEERVERMLRVHQYAQVCASAPAQYAAEAALRGDHGVVDDDRLRAPPRPPPTASTKSASTARRRRSVLRDAAGARGVVDERLDRGVVVVPGEAFGEHGRGHARSVRDRRKRAREALDVMADAYEAAVSRGSSREVRAIPAKR